MPAAAPAGYLQTTVINSAGRLQSSGFNGRLVQRLVVGEPFGDPQGIGSRKRRCRPGQKAKYIFIVVSVGTNAGRGNGVVFAIVRRSTARLFVSGGLHLSPAGPLGLEK